MRQTRTARVHLASGAILAAAAVVAGCSAESEDSDGDVLQRVSYTEHIRPILNEHCVNCHTQGSIGPFQLDDYETVASMAPLLKSVVEARTMPPFGVRADGSCQEFEDARWLTDEEIEMIAAWADGERLEGDPTIAAPPMPELPRLEGAGVAEVGIPEYLPLGSPEADLDVDDYQCFLIELDQTEDRYLVGYDVVADNDEVVHHVLGFRVDPDFLGNGATMAELDAQTPGPGWDCYGAAGEGVLPQGVPVTWAPGQGAVNFPEGVGVKFSPGDVMVVQMHYNLLDAGGKDATRIRLKWSDEVEREGFQILWDPFLFSSFQGTPASLEPGLESAKYEWNATFEEMLSFDGLEYIEDLELLGVIPHMHARGKTMRVDYEAADGMSCGADVDRWDYNWQRSYFYTNPPRVSSADRMHVSCDFDTTDATEPVIGGFGTQDEMCLVGLFFAPTL